MDKFISITIKLPMEQVDGFVAHKSKYIDWSELSKDYANDVSLDFLRAFQHRFVWTILLNLRLFSEEFLDEMNLNFDVDCWEVLSAKQKLSEHFIRKFASKVDWEMIKAHQNVSKKFLDDYKMFYVEENASSGAKRSV